MARGFPPAGGLEPSRPSSISILSRESPLEPCTVILIASTTRRALHHLMPPVEEAG